jgi:hypothetical protein
MLITPLELIPADAGAEKPKSDNLSNARSTAELRFRRDVETIDRLGGARVWLELLLEFGRRHCLQVEIAATVEKYAGLTPEMAEFTGADRMVPLPILLVR